MGIFSWTVLCRTLEDGSVSRVTKKLCESHSCDADKDAYVVVARESGGCTDASASARGVNSGWGGILRAGFVPSGRKIGV